MWVNTISGQRVNLLAPDPASIDIWDIGDVICPVKKMMADTQGLAIKEAESRLCVAICRKFSIDARLLAKVKHADNMAMATEKRDLLTHDLDVGCEGTEPHPDILLPLPVG